MKKQLKKKNKVSNETVRSTVKIALEWWKFPWKSDFWNLVSFPTSIIKSSLDNVLYTFLLEFIAHKRAFSNSFQNICRYFFFPIFITTLVISLRGAWDVQPLICIAYWKCFNKLCVFHFNNSRSGPTAITCVYAGVQYPEDHHSRNQIT